MSKVDYLMFFLLVMPNIGSETASIDTQSKDLSLTETILRTKSYLEKLQDDQTAITSAETKITRRAFVVRCCAHITCNGMRRGIRTKSDVTARYTQPMIMITRDRRTTPTLPMRPMFQPGPKTYFVVNQQKPAVMQPRRVLVLQPQPRVLFLPPQQVPRPPVFVVQQPPPQVAVPGQTYRVIQPPPPFVFPQLPALPFQNFFVNLLNEFLHPATLRVPAATPPVKNATTSAVKKASKKLTTVGNPVTDDGGGGGEENQQTDIPIKNGNHGPPVTVTEAGAAENTLVGAGDGEELTPVQDENKLGSDEITVATTQNPKEKLRATERIKRDADESTIEPLEYEEFVENIDDNNIIDETIKTFDNDESWLSS